MEKVFKSFNSLTGAINIKNQLEVLTMLNKFQFLKWCD